MIQRWEGLYVRSSPENLVCKFCVLYGFDLSRSHKVSWSHANEIHKSILTKKEIINTNYKYKCIIYDVVGFFFFFGDFIEYVCL